MTHIKVTKKDTSNEYIVQSTKGALLGDISYEQKWHCWIFNPIDESYYSADCMLDIAKKLRDLDEKEK
jgi:hypothetical protein